MDVVGIGGGFLLVLMIETPHSRHTHSRSSLYIYIIQTVARRCIVCYVSGDTLTEIIYIVLLMIDDWMLDLDTFERRRGNTTAWYTTTWYRLHLTL